MIRYALFCLLLILTINTYAQIWDKQNSGTTDNLRDIYFLNANTGWAVGEGGTILKTTNGGTTWVTQKIISNAFLIGCYFVDSNTGWVSGDAGVFKTTDGGATWSPQTGPYGLTKVYFNDKNNGWTVGGRDGSTPYIGDIFKTTDGGITWTQKTNNTNWARFYGIQFVDANTGWAFAEVNNTLLKTTNGGGDWQLQQSFGSSFNIQSIYFLDQNTGFMGGNDGSKGYLQKTVDGGGHWINKTPNLQYGPEYIKFFDAQNGISAGQGRSGDMAMLNTTDGGETWTIITTTFPQGFTGSGLNAGYFVDKNTGWTVGNGGIILKYNSTTEISEKGINKIPDNFILEQNYPNPFNPSTTINYSISQTSSVTLKIFDLLGNEVATLVNEEKPAGNYTAHFNAAKMASGTYFYRMTAGNLMQTKKLIILK